ncbi:Intraflagellar transport protein 80 [Cladochytrium tenue]|nr:Intraflagellar transport protein 80 [Cladochytrium tenue]
MLWAMEKATPAVRRVSEKDPKPSHPANQLVLSCIFAGRFYLCTKAGRVEKSVEAHKGAVIAVKWNSEGSALLTAGEDGALKVWSRTGMLRSGLVSTGYPVYASCWSPDNDHVLYSNGRNLVVKPLLPSNKPIQWKAHDGVVLAVDWNPVNGLIVSGGEDKKYRVWDGFGRAIYASAAHEHPVTSVAWDPSGELFCVGLFDALRICDRLGWSHSLSKPDSGSIFSIAWTPDGTQVACGGGNGAVVFGHIVDRWAQLLLGRLNLLPFLNPLERKHEWKNHDVTVLDDHKILVNDLLNGSHENLEFRDRVIKLSLGFNHLIVATSSQGYVYSDKNWNTPTIIDLAGSGRVVCIKQSSEYFVLVDSSSGLQIFSYDGRTASSPKYPSLRPERVTRNTIALSNDTLAIRDFVDEKGDDFGQSFLKVARPPFPAVAAIYVFDVASGRMIGDGPIMLPSEAAEIGLNQVIGPSSTRLLAVVDKNRELYITGVLKPCLKKLGMVEEIQIGPESDIDGTMVDSFAWNDEKDMIATITDGRFVVWYYPFVAFIDEDIEPLTRFEKDGSQLGKNCQFAAFNSTQTIVRRADGALVNISNTSSLPGVLHDVAKKKQWEDAIRLCRSVKSKELWACLAAMSVGGQDLNTAEVAYAAIEEVQKVQYVCHVRSVATAEGRAAELALLRRQPREAEAILLAAGLVYRAIRMWITLFNWERALELALKHKTHVDTVFYFRDQYLQRIGRKETIRLFLQNSSGVTLDWEKIKGKIAGEEARERSMPPKTASPSRKGQ